MNFTIGEQLFAKHWQIQKNKPRQIYVTQHEKDVKAVDEMLRIFSWFIDTHGPKIISSGQFHMVMRIDNGRFGVFKQLPESFFSELNQRHIPRLDMFNQKLIPHFRLYITFNKGHCAKNCNIPRHEEQPFNRYHSEEHVLSPVVQYDCTRISMLIGLTEKRSSLFHFSQHSWFERQILPLIFTFLFMFKDKPDSTPTHLTFGEQWFAKHWQIQKNQPRKILTQNEKDDKAVDEMIEVFSRFMEAFGPQMISSGQIIMPMRESSDRRGIFNNIRKEFFLELDRRRVPRLDMLNQKLIPQFGLHITYNEDHSRENCNIPRHQEQSLGCFHYDEYLLSPVVHYDCTRISLLIGLGEKKSSLCKFAKHSLFEKHVLPLVFAFLFTF